MTRETDNYWNEHQRNVHRAGRLRALLHGHNPRDIDTIDENKRVAERDRAALFDRMRLAGINPDDSSRLIGHARELSRRTVARFEDVLEFLLHAYHDAGSRFVEFAHIEGTVLPFRDLGGLRGIRFQIDGQEPDPDGITVTDSVLPMADVRSKR